MTASSKLPRGWIALAVTAWSVVVVGGLAAVTHYKATPGAVAPAPEGWPAATSVARTEGAPQLLLFAHPRCACTRATLAELARLLPRLGGRAEVKVLFTHPEGAAPDFLQSDLIERARQLSGVLVAIDAGGAEAARFGAATSGQVLLYDGSGALRFRGGITASRGHEGDNPGSDQLVALVQGLEAAPSTPVFGCELANAEVEVPGGQR